METACKQIKLNTAHSIVGKIFITRQLLWSAFISFMKNILNGSIRIKLDNL